MEKISVLMSLYYKEKASYFREAVESLLRQTYPFDEIVLIIDGPIGEELNETVEHYRNLLKKQLIILKNSKNEGLARSLNKGLWHCRNTLVARMDTDDVSLPTRFQKQIKTLNELEGKIRNLAILGSWYDVFDETLTKKLSTRKVPETTQKIKTFAKRRTPINHPTILLRKDIILRIGGYPENLGRFEDWGLALKVLKHGFEIYNLQESLLKFRTSAEQMARRGGLNYLKEEWQALNNLRKEGLMSNTDFLINLTLRSPARIIPDNIRHWLYKNIIWGKEA